MNNKPKFTPGPWTFHDRKAVDFENSTSAIITNEVGDAGIAHPILHIHEYNKPYTEEMAANGHLIAAAPDLYMELSDMVERFVKAAVLAGTDHEFAEIAVAKARAILRRANGQ